MGKHPGTVEWHSSRLGEKGAFESEGSPLPLAPFLTPLSSYSLQFICSSNPCLHIVKNWSGQFKTSKYYYKCKNNQYLQLVKRVLFLSFSMRFRQRVPRMQSSPPKANLHVPGSAAVFSIFVWSGWVQPRDSQTPCIREGRKAWINISPTHGDLHL